MDIASQPEKPRARERVVVLGGLGFIGSHLCRALVAHGQSVRIFDRDSAPRESLEDLSHSIEIVTGDISRPEDVVKAIGDATVLINLVHTTVPGTSMKDPGADIIDNVVSSARWLEHIGETNLRRIIYFSSGGTVYGESQTPITEDHPTNPINSYGITKLAIEKYTAMYAAHAKIDCCIVRPSNVYGPGQQLQHGQGVIGIMASQALRGKKLEVWGPRFNSRDFLFIDDMVSAIIKLLDYSGPHRVFNVSTGEGHSILEVIAELLDLITPFPEVEFLLGRQIDVAVNVLDSSRLREETGWEPTVGFKEGIQRTVERMRTFLSTDQNG